MRIAFYAPLKWPGHPVPSGDRLLARMFVAALEAAGHEVLLASRLRTYEGRGDAARQARIAAVGAAFARRLIRRWQRPDAGAPDLWFTYHVYHKAPDHLGPCVATDVSGIPELIEDGVTGLLVAPRDRDALARALARLVGDPALRARLGLAGRERVLRDFSLERGIDRLVERFNGAFVSP